jgi:hypothetical protein
MMPHHFELVEGLPFNPHGKIDYPALHVSELRSTKKIGEGGAREEDGLSPMEAVIMSIWKDVLGQDSIKHNGIFFLRGHVLFRIFVSRIFTFIDFFLNTAPFF